jgi:hypothetical protein
VVASNLLLKQACDVVIESKSCSHIMMLTS